MTAAQRPEAAEPRPRPGAQALPARPAPAPLRRPPLRVVGPRELGPRARRRRVRLVTVGAGALVSALLFGLVAFHVLIAQSQLQLGRMETQTSDAQARYDRLRLQVAQLSSPARIVAAAQERLGMVPPPGITYLSPAGPGAALRLPAPAATKPAPTTPAPAPAGPAPTAPAPAPRSTPTTAAPKTTPTTNRSTTPTTRSTTSTTAAPRNRTRP